MLLFFFFRSESSTFFFADVLSNEVKVFYFAKLKSFSLGLKSEIEQAHLNNVLNLPTVFTLKTD